VSGHVHAPTALPLGKPPLPPDRLLWPHSTSEWLGGEKRQVLVRTSWRTFLALSVACAQKFCSRQGNNTWGNAAKGTALIIISIIIIVVVVVVVTGKLKKKYSSEGSVRSSLWCRCERSEMLVSGLLVVCSGGKELTVWAWVCVWRAALRRHFYRFVGLVFSMTEENHGTHIFNI